MVGETSKLTGNCVYGHSLMDKKKHLNHKFCDLESASRHMNTPFYVNLEEFTEDVFEVRF